MLAPAAEAARAGDAIQAARLLQEAVFQLLPGGSSRLPQDWPAMMLDNARTVPPMLGPRPAITCDILKDFARPTLLMHGEKTRICYVLISEALSRCVRERSRLFFLMSTMTGRFAIRQDSALPF